MDYEKNIEIPFGASDSELHECKYTIPEGYEAKIKDGKVIVRKAESEDEQIRKGLINGFEFYSEQEYWGTEKFPLKITDILAWLEKQKSVEWSQDDLICLGYLADFVDKNGDDFYGKNKPNVVKWVRSFAELPTHEHINDIEQKPEWSEEDEKNYRRIVEAIEQDTETSEEEDNLITWLKSLKDRVLPQQIECSDANKNHINTIKRALYDAVNITPIERELAEKWPKSLRPQKQWKPTEEQMKELHKVFDSESVGWEDAVIESLYNDLKAL